jgi:hypothetical protein
MPKFGMHPEKEMHSKLALQVVCKKANITFDTKLSGCKGLFFLNLSGILAFLKQKQPPSQPATN